MTITMAFGQYETKSSNTGNKLYWKFKKKGYIHKFTDLSAELCDIHCYSTEPKKHRK